MSHQTSNAPPTQEMLESIERVLADLETQFNGGGGNCAKVACALDDLLGGAGDFVVVAGEHYEFADHVYLDWQGCLWDISGRSTRDEALEGWSDEDEPAATALEDYADPAHATIRRMADENCILSGGFDEPAFRQALQGRLHALGYPVPDQDAALCAPCIPPPVAPRPKNKP